MKLITLQESGSTRTVQINPALIECIQTRRAGPGGPVVTLIEMASGRPSIVVNNPPAEVEQLIADAWGADA